MSMRTMAKRGASPEGTYLLGKPYAFDAETEKAFEKAGAFEDGEVPRLPERAEAPKRRTRRTTKKADG